MTDSLPPSRPFPLFIPSLIAAFLCVASSGGSVAYAGPPTKGSTTPPAQKSDAGDTDIMTSLLSTDTNPDPQVRVIASNPPSWYPQFAQALAASQAGKRAEAKQIYHKLLQAQPRVAEAWANLGILEAQEHHDAAAIADSEKAVSFATDSHLKVSMLTQLMRLNAHSGNWQAVAGAARRTIDIAPEGSPNTLATAYLSISLMRLGRYADALPYLRKRAMLYGEPATAADLRLIYTLNQTGHSDEALTLAQQLADRLPKDATAQVALGDTAVDVRRIDIALRAFGTAYMLRPTDSRAGQNAVAAAAQLGRNDIAFELLQKMLKQSPDDDKVLFAIGKLYFLQPGNTIEQFEKAEKNLRQAATKKPTGPTYVSLLGQSILMQRKPERFAEASKLLQGALQLDPHDDFARLGLGYLAEQQVQFDKEKGPDHYVEAIDQYKAIVADSRHDGHEAQARRRLAGIYLVLNQKADGYREFEALMTRFPNDTSDLDELASLYYADARYDDAASAYRRLIAAVPQNPEAYVGLGQTLERMKKPADAQAQYESALRVKPGYGTAALALGNLLKSENKGDDAIAVYETAAKASPNDNPLHVQLGSDYEQKGRLDDAIKQYQALTLLNDDPNREKYLLMAPMVLLSHARSPEAEKMLTRIYQENPKNDAVAFKLATAQENSGHPDAAAATFQKVIARHSEKPAETVPARLELAELFERIHEPEQAAAGFEDTLRIDLPNKEALMGLSRTRTALQHPEAAGAFVESLATGDPAEPNMTVVGVAEHLYDAMDRTPERYTAFLQKLTDKYPNDRPLAMLRLAHLLDLNGVKKPENRIEAEKLLLPLLVKTPNDPELHFRLGTIREEDGRKPEAIAEYTAAVKQNFGYGPGIAALQRLGAPVPLPSTPAVATLPGSSTAASSGTGAPPGSKSDKRP